MKQKSGKEALDWWMTVLSPETCLQLRKKYKFSSRKGIRTEDIVMIYEKERELSPELSISAVEYNGESHKMKLHCYEFAINKKIPLNSQKQRDLFQLIICVAIQKYFDQVNFKK